MRPNALGGVQLVDETFSTEADREDSSVNGNASDHESATPNRNNSQQGDPSIEVKATGEGSKTVLSPTIVVTTSTDTEESAAEPDSQSEGDRQHLAHFKSWGTPAARSKPSEYCFSSC